MRRGVDGIVGMMLDATQRYAYPLDAERLSAWRASLFPSRRSGMSRMTVRVAAPSPRLRPSLPSVAGIPRLPGVAVRSL